MNQLILITIKTLNLLKTKFLLTNKQPRLTSI